MRRIALLLLLLAAPAFAQGIPQPTEREVRYEAAIMEVVHQRDVAQARAANLAGDVAAKDLRIKQAEADRDRAVAERDSLKAK